MESSQFLAQFMGLYMVLIAVPLIFTPVNFKKRYEHFINNMDEMLFAGVFTLMLGLGFVLAHNIWVANWRVIITLIAWITLIEGISMIYFPEQSQSIFKKLGKKLPSMAIGLTYLIVGLFLTMKGFF